MQSKPSSVLNDACSHCCLCSVLPKLNVSSSDWDSQSLVAQKVKNQPAVQETRVRFLGWKDPQEKEMATHSRILARRIPWVEEPGMLQSVGSQSQTRLSD